MRPYIPHLLLALAVLAQVHLARAEPFDVRSYRQGMSLEQVLHLAEQQGHTARRDSQIPNRVTVLQGGTHFLDLALCNDRVFNASWLVDGGLDRFVKQLDSLTKQGLQKTDVSWRSDLGYDGKEHFDLSIYFIRPGSEKEYYVTATLFASEKHGTTNSQVSWSARDGYCK